MEIMEKVTKDFQLILKACHCGKSFVGFYPEKSFFFMKVIDLGTDDLQFQVETVIYKSSGIFKLKLSYEWIIRHDFSEK